MEELGRETVLRGVGNQRKIKKKKKKLGGKLRGNSELC